jgi:hypothetical protein
MMTEPTTEVPARREVKRSRLVIVSNRLPLTVVPTGDG